jgi:hypothetical protein
VEEAGAVLVVASTVEAVLPAAAFGALVSAELLISEAFRHLVHALG